MKKYKQLGSLMPLTISLLVGGCMIQALNAYEAPVYAVEVIETEGIVGNETESESVGISGDFDLSDGVYDGKGVGFKGTIRVAVEIKDHTIKAIEVLSHSDDVAFFNRAKQVISKVLETQTWEVDTVSGATYSSKGILAAIKHALTGEEDQSSLPASTGSSNGKGSTSIERVEENARYKDGTFTGSGTGFGGKLKVSVTIKGGKIENIELLSHQDDTSYIVRAKSVLKNIISKQSTNVDTVSGATYSSVGLIEAVRDALKKAETTEQIPETEIDETEQTNEIIKGTIPYNEGIYYGKGEGFNGAIEVAVVIQNHTMIGILITQTEDDEAFFNRALTIRDQIILKQGLEEIDVVSGATYSSMGIIDAIKDALLKAEKATNGMKEPESENELESETAIESENESESETEIESEIESESESDSETEMESETQLPETLYKDGIYAITVPCLPDLDGDFDAYQLSMNIEIKSDCIIGITDVTGDGDSSNNRYIQWAMEGRSGQKGVVTQIIEKGNAENIDSVTRATCTSKSIIEACKQVFDLAGRD